LSACGACPSYSSAPTSSRWNWCGARDPQTLAAMMRRFGASPGLRLFSMHTWDEMPEVRREIAAEVLALLAAGRIDPPIHARLPLAQARQAHELFEMHAHRGKIVLGP
jgi:NADPH2:quinone reductase